MAKPQKFLDLLIIGAGIAGLTAGIYAARMKLDTLILEDALIGGQIIDAYGIENYPGFHSIKGSHLIEKIEEQALHFGAKIDEFDTIIAVKLTDTEKIIETQSFIYKPTAVIIAAGMDRRKLPVIEEKHFRGKGIHYCELCDGHLYQGKSIAVVGGGNAAVDAANFLDKYAKKIYIIHRSPALTASAMSQEKLRNNPKIEFLFNTNIVKASGEYSLESVIIENVLTKEQKLLALDGIFVNIGVVPKTQLYQHDIELDAALHIKAGETCETNIKGVFAAGDIRTKLIRQLTTAAADGTVAALLAEKYIMQKERGNKV
ncbi:MAG: Thioredoxin-disulfide reductase [Firmicutes bacterium]|nr:Thioredoxin-disulfide reductase [Bacillota bacterium]